MAPYFELQASAADGQPVPARERKVLELQSRNLRLGMEALAACGCDAAGLLHLQSTRAKRADIGKNALAMSIVVVAAASGGVG